MCMGASSGMASGLSLFKNEKRVVAFIGDSTFFHAGLPGLINAIFNNQDICNKTHDRVEHFGCPTFIRNPDSRIDINFDLCIGDGSCRDHCHCRGYPRTGPERRHCRFKDSMRSQCAFSLIMKKRANLVLGMEVHEAMRGLDTALKKGGTLVYLDVSW